MPLLTAALRHGLYYVGRSRNANVARWNADENMFYHWRHEAGFIFIETIQPCDIEADNRRDCFEPDHELHAPTPEIPFNREAQYSGHVRF